MCGALIGKNMSELQNTTKSLLKDIVFIIVSCFIMAFGMVIFTIPNNIAPGGLSGLATALSYLIEELAGIHIGVGYITFAFQIPIILIAAKLFGVKTIAKTLFTAVMYSGSIELVGLIPNLYTHTDNQLLAAVMGGAMIGIGVGMLFMRDIATGGTDMVSLILKSRFPQLPAGTLMTCVDACIVLIAVIIFRNIEVALYSGISIFVMGKVIDAVMQGADHAKVFMIVTGEADMMLSKLENELSRGVTEIPAKGGYSRQEKRMLLTVARRNDIAKIMRLIKSVDPQSFVITYNAAEVLGRGFKKI